MELQGLSRSAVDNAILFTCLCHRYTQQAPDYDPDKDRAKANSKRPPRRVDTRSDHGVERQSRRGKRSSTAHGSRDKPSWQGSTALSQPLLAALQHPKPRPERRKKPSPRHKPMSASATKAHSASAMLTHDHKQHPASASFSTVDLNKEIEDTSRENLVSLLQGQTNKVKELRAQLAKQRRLNASLKRHHEQEMKDLVRGCWGDSLRVCTLADPHGVVATYVQEESRARDHMRHEKVAHDAEIMALKGQIATARRHAAKARRRCLRLETNAAKERALVAQLERDLQLEVPHTLQHRHDLTAVQHEQADAKDGKKAKRKDVSANDEPTHLDDFVANMLLAMRKREKLLVARRRKANKQAGKAGRPERKHGSSDGMVPGDVNKARAKAAHDTELARISAFAVAVDYFQRGTRLGAALKEWHSHAMGLRQALKKLEEETGRTSQAVSTDPELDIHFDGTPLVSELPPLSDDDTGGADGAADGDGSQNDGFDAWQGDGEDTPATGTLPEEQLAAGKERQREHNAAARVQASARGRIARRRVEALKQEKADQEEAQAAARVQAVARGRRDRKRVEDLRTAQAESAAATKMQAVARGNRDRKIAQGTQDRRARGIGAEQEAQAATKIQAAARGRRDRRRVEELRREAWAQDEGAQAAATKVQAYARGRRDRQRVAELRNQQGGGEGDSKDGAPGGDDDGDSGSDYAGDTFEDDGTAVEDYFSDGHDDDAAVASHNEHHVPPVRFSSFRVQGTQSDAPGAPGNARDDDTESAAHLNPEEDGRGLWVGVVRFGTDGFASAEGQRHVTVQVTQFTVPVDKSTSKSEGRATSSPDESGESKELLLVEAYDSRTVQSFGSSFVPLDSVEAGLKRMREASGNGATARRPLASGEGVPQLVRDLLQLVVLVDNFRADSIDLDPSWQLPLMEVDSDNGVVARAPISAE